LISWRCFAHTGGRTDSWHGSCIEVAAVPVEVANIEQK
jgi:hypothetical protein